MWINGKKCAVFLCFDFDAESLWIGKNLTTPSVMSRGEYGDRVGVPRILALVDKYSIKATFAVREFIKIVDLAFPESRARTHVSVRNEGGARNKIDVISVT